MHNHPANNIPRESVLRRADGQLTPIGAAVHCARAWRETLRDETLARWRGHDERAERDARMLAEIRRAQGAGS